MKATVLHNPAGCGINSDFTISRRDLRRTLSEIISRLSIRWHKIFEDPESLTAIATLTVGFIETTTIISNYNLSGQSLIFMCAKATSLKNVLFAFIFSPHNPQIGRASCR